MDKGYLRAVAFFLMVLSAWHVAAGNRIEFRIPEQRADQALNLFAQQAEVQILFPYKRVSRYTANPLNGSYTIDQGLRALLFNTGLEARFDQAAGVMIVRVSDDERGAMTEEKSRSAGLLAGILAGIFGAAQAPAADDAGDSRKELEDIVVTVQKREQTLQDVPVAVTALGAQSIDNRGIVDFSSYLRTVPSVSLEERGNQGLEVKIRGVGNGTSQLSPTTAIYLGEVPIIHTGRGANSSYNFRIVDMDRIEVLRGPQGQLYGSNSLGGAVKNVPRAPALDGLTLSGSASAADTTDGDTSYNADLTLNLPLSAELGLRVTGYHAVEGGWYDNVFTGGPNLGDLSNFSPPPPFPGSLLPFIIAENPAVANYSAPSAARDDVNEQTISGGRLLGTWRISDRFSADLMLAYEEKETDGVAWTTEVPNVPGFIPGSFGSGIATLYLTDAEDYEQASPVNAETSDEIFVANLLLEYEFDFATLTSSTSYWDRTEELSNDLGIIAFFPTGISGTVPALQTRVDDPDTFIQEFRLTSNDDGPLTWLAGVFYQEIDQDFSNAQYDLSGIDFYYTERIVRSNLFGIPMPTTTVLIQETANFKDEQFAVFGEVAYDILPSLNAAFSFRWFDLQQEATRTNFGFRSGDPGTRYNENDDQVFTPKFTLTWTPSDDYLVYATAAEGFRTGVTNLDVPLSQCQQELQNAGSPGGVGPTEADTLWNYELGAKLSLAEQRVTVNGAVFHIDWSDLQNQIFLNSFAANPAQSSCTYGVILNVGDATIEGVELEASALLTDNLQINGSLSYLDAEYDDDLPQVRIDAGETIQNTTELQTFLSLQYDFSLFARPSFGLFEWNYVGDISKIPADFESQELPFDLGDFHVLNMRVGTQITDAVSLDLWVRNLTDEFGVVSALDLGGAVPPTGFTIRPRTYGATLRWNF